MTRSGRAWWDSVATGAADPFELDGYGEIARAGGERLLEHITTDVRTKLDLRPHHALLEVGCGAGAITHGLESHARRIIAVDFSPSMLRRARAASSAVTRFAAADAGQLPLRTHTFDRVLCYSVFNNFPTLAYAERALLELIRVTKPGGVVLVGQLPNADRRHDWYSAYHARFGGRPRSSLRMALGLAKRQLVDVWHDLRGQPPAPALEILYYPASFVPTVLNRTPHRCDVVPAYDLINDGDTGRDYRLDARIAVDG